MKEVGKIKASIIIFFCGITLFTIGLPDEFVGFQCRFALFAQEMLRNGPTLFPTTFDTPYPDYPATSTFLIYLPARLTGEVTPLIAVLPTAVASSLILVFTYLVGARISRKWGLLAVLFSMLTFTFVKESREISLDQFISLLTLIGFYALSSPAAGPTTAWKWALLPLLFVAGFAIRGPIGLVIPAAVASGYFLWEREYVKFIFTTVISGILLVGCMVALVYAARLSGGEHFAKEVLEMQMAGRISSHDNPPLYYWYRSLGEYAIAFPLAICVSAALFRKWLRPVRAEERLLAHLVVWMLIILVGMSIPGTKSSRYILPILPSITLIASYLLTEKNDLPFLIGMRFHLVRFFAMFPLYAVIGAIATAVYIAKEGLTPDWELVPILLMLVTTAGLGAVLKLKCNDWAAQKTLLTATAAAALVILYIGIIQPIYYDREHTTSFVSQVEQLREATPGPLVFYQIGPDGEDIKYAVNAGHSLQPEYFDKPEKMLTYGENACFVALQKYYDALPEHLVAQTVPLAKGNLGHKECIAFKLTRPVSFLEKPAFMIDK